MLENKNLYSIEPNFKMIAGKNIPLIVDLIGANWNVCYYHKIQITLFGYSLFIGDFCKANVSIASVTLSLRLWY